MQKREQIGSVPNLLNRLQRAYKTGISAYRINKFETLPTIERIIPLSVRRCILAGTPIQIRCECSIKRRAGSEQGVVAA